MAANRSRFHVAGALALAGLLALGICSCAGSGATGPDESTPSAQEQGEEHVQDVLVESEAGLTRVTLVGLENPIFTAFQQTDPDRLIVDLSGVEWEASKDPVQVNDGTIKQVMVAPYATGSDESMTRVEVALVSAADYDVRPGPRGLVIEVSPLAEMGSLDESSHGDAMAGESDPWASQSAAATDTDASGDFESMPAEGGDAEQAPARMATKLERVDAAKAGDHGVVIHLVADGSVENAASFTLADPPRLVVDLSGMKSAAKAKTEVGAGGVQRVRVGMHEDKVRVVIDGDPSGDPFDGRRVLPVATGLVIALGEGDEVEAAMADASKQMPSGAPAAPAATAAADSGAGHSGDAMAPHTSGLASIESVEFDSQAERDRVLIHSAEPVDYLVYEPDADTVVLSIAGATLAADANVRIAPEAAGPVSLVTAFEQPDVKTPEVRVVMKRAAGLKPTVSREGEMLMVDFPRTGEASKPPVMAMEDGTAPSPSAAMPGSSSLGNAVATLATQGSAATAVPASIAPGAPGMALDSHPGPRPSTIRPRSRS